MSTTRPLRPNILLICVDQWRGDCLSIADHPVVHTPWLDQLALDGVRCTRAYAACPTCIPARASLYTGLTQRTHSRIGYRDGVPWDYPTTIASEFTRHGYQTQAIGKLHVYPERSQIGFQNVILHDGFLHHARQNHPNVACIDDYIPWLRRELGRPDADYFDHGVNCNSNVARPLDKDESLHPTNWVVTQALAFLQRRDPRKPFFLYLGFHRPHPPYDPPQWAFDQYINADMPDVPVGDWVDTMAAFGHPRHPATHVGQLPPHLLRRARAGYYGHLSHIDHQINRLLEQLPERQAGPTYVCFVSDHGEMMGDHHLWQKGLPYEGSARVPLILQGPRDSSFRKGPINELIELRDIMPTLLDCAELQVPEMVEGRSFLPIARGQHVAWRNHLHGEHLSLRQSVQYITDQRFKYIWFSQSGHEQLFDLDQDPSETRNLAGVPEFSDDLRRLRGLLVHELDGREEGFSDGHALMTGRPVRECLSHREWRCLAREVSP